EGQEGVLSEVFLAGTQPKDTAPEPEPTGEGGGAAAPGEPSAEKPNEPTPPPVEEPPPVLPSPAPRG
ncbi:MAG: hypothetical protein JNL21_22715, partial [Myxococcales bacterium]|nr:hypothetical protein [Myxococcales bacterium]